MNALGISRVTTCGVTIKGRHCYNGKPQRAWVSREEKASPTVATDAIILTSGIEAEEGRHVVTLDIPNAFIQTELPDGEEKIMMKVKGSLADLLVEMDPLLFEPYLHCEKD